ncbi:4-alpha-L-fucosyltransferase [Actinomortierella wolfii]|nr:4-alpha-L-fucosyltransferase [Actinomortierella wolfii]
MSAAGQGLSWMEKARRYHVIRIMAIAVIISILLLQFSVFYARSQPIVPEAQQNVPVEEGQMEDNINQLPSTNPDIEAKTNPEVKAKPEVKTNPEVNTNKNVGVKIRPSEQIDFCNHLTKPRHPQRLHIAKRPDEPLRVFTWRQTTWSHNIDWVKESRTMCPISLALQPFFDHFLEVRAKVPGLKWEAGYAPCIFWKLADGKINHRTRQCSTSIFGPVNYIMSTNYTAFEDADIIYFDYPFWDAIDKPPYIDLANMPPRLAHQKWVLWWRGESIAYYPHVGLPEYLNLFDLTIGSPEAIMDIPLPLYDLTAQKIRKLANVPPSFPLDKVAENPVVMLVGNCGAKNHRQELMKVLIDRVGAHSLGTCMNNKQLPEELNKDSGKDGWGDWMTKKLKAIQGYPFVFAAENSNCRSYVTEKIYHALEVGAIPIYMGAEDVADYVPEGSYIDVSKFKSFEEVADYIKTVDRAPFYKWKEIVKNDPSKFCKKCFRTRGSAMCKIIDRVQFVQ